MITKNIGKEGIATRLLIAPQTLIFFAYLLGEDHEK